MQVCDGMSSQSNPPNCACSQIETMQRRFLMGRPESTAFPKWLWDCEKECSVLAGNEQFKKGYIAVPYTWGRSQTDSTHVSGKLS